MSCRKWWLHRWRSWNIDDIEVLTVENWCGLMLLRMGLVGIPVTHWRPFQPHRRHHASSHSARVVFCQVLPSLRFGRNETWLRSAFKRDVPGVGSPVRYHSAPLVFLFFLSHSMLVSLKELWKEKWVITYLCGLSTWFVYFRITQVKLEMTRAQTSIF